MSDSKKNTGPGPWRPWRAASIANGWIAVAPGRIALRVTQVEARRVAPGELHEMREVDLPAPTLYEHDLSLAEVAILEMVNAGLKVLRPPAEAHTRKWLAERAKGSL